MKRIVTVQHAQSQHHVNGMVGSWTDWPLTPLGLAQAQAVGQKLAAELQGQDAVLYCSDLLRARQTAEQIGRRLRLTPIPRQELRERNLGRCCGKSVQWLRENMERPERTVDDRLFSDGESRRDAWNRLRPFFAEIMADSRQTVLIVSHGDLLGLFHAMFLGLEAESLNSCQFSGSAGGVSHLAVEPHGTRMVWRLNDLSYLSGETEPLRP